MQQLLGNDSIQKDGTVNRRVIAQGPPAYVLTTEHISEAFGAQAHVFQGMVVIDECCPPPGTIEER